MMKIIDLYRGGYKLGNMHGQQGERRKAEWELAVTHPLTWLPGVDQSSFFSGYLDGYRDGMALRILCITHFLL
jgi:hypothetical protein